jgi:hypothetical protein
MALIYNMTHPRKDDKTDKTYWDPIGTLFLQADDNGDIKAWGRLNTGCEFSAFPAKKRDQEAGPSFE